MVTLSIKQLKINVESLKSRVSTLAKTIRFKLAFLYSGILFFFAGGILLVLNLFLANNFRQDPPPRQVQVIPFTDSNAILYFDDFDSLRFEEKQRIKNIRLNDLRIFQKVSLYSLFPLAVLSFLAGYFISGKYLNPLERLKNNLESLNSKDLGIHFKPDNEDEVGALIMSFNNLSTRLQTAFSSQEQFVQNAAHELRTPLTVIQTNLDTMLDNPKATAQETNEAIKDALVGVKQLGKLVNYLLELTSLKATTFEPINVKMIVKEQVNSIIHSYPNEQVAFDLQSPPKKLIIDGDAFTFSRVISNLLENALKYAARDASGRTLISIKLTTDANTAVIKISNKLTQSISGEVLAKLFDRFYQLDTSRNKKMGGYGLGLAIVKKIVEEHHGNVVAETHGDEISFVMRFPLGSKR